MRRQKAQKTSDDNKDDGDDDDSPIFSYAKLICLSNKANSE